MLLAVDVGNSHTVFGLFEGDRRVADWRLATRAEITADELGVTLLSLFDLAGRSREEVAGMVVATVVPDLQHVLTRTGERFFGCAPLFVEPGIKTGMPIRYDNPQEVGADRIVNAVAALERYGAPVIILDFGTATTFDVVSADGCYQGGVIAPGLGVSAEALFEKAARLHRVDIQRPQRVVGRNTEESVQSGLFHGYAALVDGLVAKIRGEIGDATKVIATGGLARVFAEEIDDLEAVDTGLTLEGLRLLWERNRP